MKAPKIERTTCRGPADDYDSWCKNDRIVLVPFQDIVDADHDYTICVCTECGGPYPPEQLPPCPRPTVEEDGDDGYGYSGTRTWVFDPYTDDDQIALILQEAGYPVDGTRCYHSYDCCGHIYYNSIMIDRTLLATFVTQSFYQNV